MAHIGFLNNLFLIICTLLIYLIFAFIFAIILSMVILNYHHLFYELHILVMVEIIRIDYLLISLLFLLGLMLMILSALIFYPTIPSLVHFIHLIYLFFLFLIITLPYFPHIFHEKMYVVTHFSVQMDLFLVLKNHQHLILHLCLSLISKTLVFILLSNFKILFIRHYSFFKQNFYFF